MKRFSMQHSGATRARGDSRWRTRRAVSAWLFGLLLVSTAGHGSDSPAAAEYKVKADYLFTLARFIEWPAPSVSGATAPFTIAVMDRGEATPVLEQLFAGKDIAGHPVEVRSVALNNVPKDAHILLVTRAAGIIPEEIRETLGSAPTLLVGETEKFAERGGAIAFVLEERTIRLTLCREHASERGLKVNARLASVARLVRSARTK